MSDPAFVAGLRPIASGPLGTHQRRPAVDIAGDRPDGSPVEVQIATHVRPLLLAFLHTRCDGCEGFWRGMRDQGGRDPAGHDTPPGQPRLGAVSREDRSGGADPGAADVGLPDGVDDRLPDGVDAVIVTKGADAVDAVDVATLAAGVTRVPVVMSTRAWSDYQVLSYPFFALVDPATRSVVGETVGFGWSDVAAMVRSSIGPATGPADPPFRPATAPG